MHMERKHAKEKSVHASGGSRRTWRRRRTGRPQGRLAAGKEGGTPVRQAGVDRQAAIYFHPNLNSIFALPLSHSEILENEAVSVPPHVKRASEPKSEGREGRAFYHVDAREIKPSRNGRARERGTEQGNGRR